MAKAQIRRTRLTDGSHVFDVILTDDDGAREHRIELNCLDEDAAQTVFQSLGSDADCELDHEVIEAAH